MAWGIEKKDDGYYWFFSLSSHGSIVGVEPTLERAYLESIIGQNIVMETPLSKAYVRKIRRNPSIILKEYPPLTKNKEGNYGSCLNR